MDLFLSLRSSHIITIVQPTAHVEFGCAARCLFESLIDGCLLIDYHNDGNCRCLCRLWEALGGLSSHISPAFHRILAGGMPCLPSEVTAAVRMCLKIPLEYAFLDPYADSEYVEVLVPNNFQASPSLPKSRCYVKVCIKVASLFSDA